jgi:hypothetical protein
VSTVVDFPAPSSSLPPQVKPVIYFAGKISKHGWRDTLLGHRAGGVGEPDIWNPDFMLETPGFHYGGPFFISCDHGCGHARNAHGAECCENPDLRKTQLLVWSLNRARLGQADVVFAYIDEVTCFGTMFEIGMATEMGKPIVIGFGPHLTSTQISDLWTLHIYADAVFFGDAAQTWAKARRHWGIP